MAEFQGNVFTLDEPGDSSHADMPGQHIYVGEVHLYGGDVDDNVLLLDTDGVSREGPGPHDAFNQLDPRVICSGTVLANTFTRIPVNRKVRGLFLDDIPVGGKVIVTVGDPNA